MKFKTLCSSLLIGFTLFTTSPAQAEITLVYSYEHDDIFTFASRNLIFIEEQNFYVYLEARRIIFSPSESKRTVFEHPPSESRSSSSAKQLLHDLVTKPETNVYYSPQALDDSSTYYHVKVYAPSPIQLSARSYYTLNHSDKNQYPLFGKGPLLNDSLKISDKHLYLTEYYTPATVIGGGGHPYLVAQKNSYFSTLGFLGKNNIKWLTETHKKKNNPIELHLFFEDREPVTVQITDAMRAEWRYVLKPTKSEKKQIHQFLKEQIIIARQTPEKPYHNEILWNPQTGTSEEKEPELYFRKKLD